MGNVLDSTKYNAPPSDDSDWLNVHNSSIFNDVYVGGICDELAKFEEIEIEKVLS